MYNENLAGRLAIPITSSYSQQHIYGNITVINRDGIDHNVFPLTRQKCRIGRELDCDIRIQRPTVSKEHAIISIENDKVYLQNLSENGLLLCGKFIGKTNPETKQNMEKILLNDGDVFTISGRSFRFNYPRSSKPIHTLLYQPSLKPPTNTTLSNIINENILPSFNSPNRTPKKELLKEALNTLLPYATPTKQTNINIQSDSILSPFVPSDKIIDNPSIALNQDLIIFSPNTNTESKRKSLLSSPIPSKRTISKFKIENVPAPNIESTTLSNTEIKANQHKLDLPFLTPQQSKKKTISKELQDLINRNTIISSPSLIKTPKVDDIVNSDISISGSELAPNSSKKSSNLNNKSLSTIEEYNINIGSPLGSPNMNNRLEGYSIKNSESTPPPLFSPTKSPPIAKRTRRHNIITESLDSIIAASPTIGRRTPRKK